MVQCAASVCQYDDDEPVRLFVEYIFMFSFFHSSVAIARSLPILYTSSYAPMLC